MPQVRSITQAAALLRVSPALLSNWFWMGKLDRQRCIMAAGRTLIPDDYLVGVIIPELRGAGYDVPEFELAAGK